MRVSVRSTVAMLCAASIVNATAAEDAVALGRKALANEGVAMAWRFAQQALNELPVSAPALEFAGEVSFRRGDFTEAEAEFKQALKLQPNLARAWWGLARIAECSSMFETAARYFNRA